ncbi:MAG: peptidoglycan DD-metalloendopeptidase family protein [Prochlorococcus sp.]
MKPLLLLIPAIATPVLSLGPLSALPVNADSDLVKSQLLGPPPPVPGEGLKDQQDVQNKIWVKVANPTTTHIVASKLGLSVSELALHNSSPYLKQGSWLAIPKTSQGQLDRVVDLDASQVRSSAPTTPLPIASPPPPTSIVKVDKDDSAASIAKKHGLTLESLRNLNPGLEFGRLIIGTTVRVANATPRALLAIKPLRSGGASWPRLPSLPSFEDKNQDLNGHKGYIWPTKGVFTSGYGWRWGRMHQGIDIANKVGTPIVAAKDGIVIYSGWKSSYGYFIEIAHADGSSTRYAHSSVLLVKKGQIVPQGTKISLMGSTGRSTGPHLHFEIRKSGGTATNPLTLLPQKRS